MRFAAGVLKALVGMSASIFTTIYVAGFRPEALSFLLFIAVAPAVLGLLALPFLDAHTGSLATIEDGPWKGALSQNGTTIWNVSPGFSIQKNTPTRFLKKCLVKRCLYLLTFLSVSTLAQYHVCRSTALAGADLRLVPVHVSHERLL